MRAQCLLPEGPNYRRAAFIDGLRSAGFDVLPRIDRPSPGDVLVIWNRPVPKESEALRFEDAGARVLVVENGYFGKEWMGRKWFSMALGHHAGAGAWPVGGPKRWDSWGVDLKPWRTGSETLILAQRGIGEPGIASPIGWADSVQRRVGGRVRRHPGKYPPAVTLAEDLRDVGSVVTWHSGGALQALLLGVPVWYGFKRWIGAEACRPLSEFGAEPKKDDAARLSMLRRLAWALWDVSEIENGTAFRHLGVCKI